MENFERQIKSDMGNLPLPENYSPHNLGELTNVNFNVERYNQSFLEAYDEISQSVNPEKMEVAKDAAEQVHRACGFLLLGVPADEAYRIGNAGVAAIKDYAKGKIEGTDYRLNGGQRLIKKFLSPDTAVKAEGTFIAAKILNYMLGNKLGLEPVSSGNIPKNNGTDSSISHKKYFYTVAQGKREGQSQVHSISIEEDSKKPHRTRITYTDTVALNGRPLFS